MLGPLTLRCEMQMSKVCDSLYWLTRTCYSRSLPDTACHKTLIVFTSPVTSNLKLKRFPVMSRSVRFSMWKYTLPSCQCLITKREQGNNFHFIFILDKEKVMVWIENLHFHLFLWENIWMVFIHVFPIQMECDIQMIKGDMDTHESVEPLIDFSYWKMRS